jgi:hypothetical protein
MLNKISPQSPLELALRADDAGVERKEMGKEGLGERHVTTVSFKKTRTKTTAHHSSQK